MDFAELSGLEYKVFDDYKHEVVEQFSQDVHQAIVDAERSYFFSFKKNSGWMVKTIIPFAPLFDAFHDAYKADEGQFYSGPSQAIKERVVAKFSEMISRVGANVDKVMISANKDYDDYQEKIKEKEEELAVKSETIQSLNAELDQVKNILLDETIKTPENELKRLKFKLRTLESSNKNLERTITNLKEKHHREILAYERTKKAKVVNNSKEIEDLKKLLEEITNRNRQLNLSVDKIKQQPTENEEPNKESGNLLTFLRDVSGWASAKTAEFLGLKDLVEMGKNFGLIAENIFKGIVIIIYAYTFYTSLQNYTNWLNNSWRSPQNKYYALSILPIIFFCMFKLLKF